MSFVRKIALAAVWVLSSGLLSCGGGGNGTEEIRIVSISLDPAVATASAVVTLSASISAPGQSTSALVKNWTASTGTLSITPPDFSLTPREVSRTASSSSVSTTAAQVYWHAPDTAVSAVITLEVEQDTKTRTVQVTESPLILSVSSATGNTKVCTVSANNVTNLRQAAFRIKFSSAWTPQSVEAGDFLGDAADILFLGLTNQTGFVPCAITKRGNVAGETGSGTLATITFAPKSSASAAPQSPFASFSLFDAQLVTGSAALVP